MKYNVQFDLELRKNPYKGIYIVLEGIDGSGKSTQVERIKEYFEKKGLPAGRQGQKVLLTHEPTRQPPIGDIIHNVLQGKMKLPAVSLQYLFAADREVHLERVIEPSLKKGKIIIAERCFLSSIPYGILDKLGKLNDGEILLVSQSILSMYHQFMIPDFIFYIKVSENTAIKRLAKMNKKKEYYETAEKLKNIKAGYEWLSKKFPDEITVIGGEKPQEEVTADITKNLEFRI